jgi:FkbM family methyltransferase
MIESLILNPLFAESDVTVYCDGAKSDADVADVDATRRVIRELLPQARIVARDRNIGLANSIIAGVSEQCEQAGRTIVLEDDLILSPFALDYFNRALDRYVDNDKVMHIAGYMFPVDASLPPSFFYREASCWGWATWKRAWQEFDPSADRILRSIDAGNLRRAFDINNTMYFYDMLKLQSEGKIDSWAIRWYGSMFLRKGLALHPARAVVANEGFDGTGRHSGTTTEFAVDLAQEVFPPAAFPDDITEDSNAVHAMMRYRRTRYGETKLKVVETEMEGFKSLRLLLGRLDIAPVLVDVGCSGAEQKIWRPIVEASTVLAFDPDERAIPDELYDSAKRLIMINKAVATHDDDTTVDFVLTRSPSCSSTLEPALDSLVDWSFHDRFIPERRVTVPAISLNAAVAEAGLNTIDWIKVDSQGTDLRIIKSLKPELFDRLLAVSVEPGLIDAYQGEDLFWAVHRFMSENGFWLADINLQKFPRATTDSIAAMARLAGLSCETEVNNMLRPSPTAVEALYLRTPKWLEKNGIGLQQTTISFAFSLIADQIGAAFDIAARLEKSGHGDVAAAMKEIVRLRLIETRICQRRDASIVRKLALRMVRSAKYRFTAFKRRLVG